MQAGATESGEHLVTADVAPHAAEAALRLLAARVAPDAVTLLRVESVSPADSRTSRRWLGRDPNVASWPEVIQEARGSARLFGRFLALMAAAGVVASVGVDSRNPILVIGAMAISPDLLPLSAACVGLVTMRPRLVARSLTTLVIGLGVVSLFAALTALLLDAFDVYGGDLGSGGLGVLTHTDLATIVIALAAGVAGMLAFETRAGAAVGVAISVTTIPAAAYLGVAAQTEHGGDAAGAAGVLATNLVCVLVAGSLTLLTQRWVPTVLRRASSSHAVDTGVERA
jgi:uncharacterized hydrophobic protein (TIGR00271 family)